MAAAAFVYAGVTAACSATCGLCSAACGTLEQDTRRSAVLGRLIYTGLWMLAAGLAALLLNLPQWVDAAVDAAPVPGFGGCAPPGPDAGATDDWVAWARGWLARQLGAAAATAAETAGVDWRVPAALCTGTLHAYRVAATVALFHALLAAVMLGTRRTTDARHVLQHAWWPAKTLALAALALVVFLGVPDLMWPVVAWAALAASALFVLAQLVLLLDAGYVLAEAGAALVASAGRSPAWAALVVSGALALLAAALGGTVALAVQLGMGGGAVDTGALGLDATQAGLVVGAHLVLVGLLTGATVLPPVLRRNPRASLLPAVTTAAVMTLLVASALLGNAATRAVQLVLAGATLLYAVLRPPGGAAVSAAATDADAADTGTDAAVAYSYTRFHLLFLLAALYVGTVLAGWATLRLDAASGALAWDPTPAGPWMQLAAAAVAAVLYLWSLTAPLACPHRFQTAALY